MELVRNISRNLRLEEPATLINLPSHGLHAPRALSETARNTEPILPRALSETARNTEPIQLIY